METLLEPPNWCQEIPGFILVIEPGKSWLTKDGFKTEVFNDRGVWNTVEDAEKALDYFFNDNF